MEINDLARSVSEKYLDRSLYKVECFLHEEVRKRFQALMSEFNATSQVPLITHDRQPCHRAVEEEIQRRDTDIDNDIDTVVDAVLRRDPAYPSERVRAYTAYILETASGLW
jgi:hypothetical protein